MASGYRRIRIAAGTHPCQQERLEAIQSEMVGWTSLGARSGSRSSSGLAARRCQESHCWYWRFGTREAWSVRIGARRICSPLLPSAPVREPPVAVAGLVSASRLRIGASVLGSSHILVSSSLSRKQRSESAEFAIFDSPRFLSSFSPRPNPMVAAVYGKLSRLEALDSGGKGDTYQLDFV